MMGCWKKQIVVLGSFSSKILPQGQSDVKSPPKTKDSRGPSLEESTMVKVELRQIRSRFQILESFNLFAPNSSDRMDFLQDGCIALYKESFRARF